MIELYAIASPNVQKIIIMLEETGLPYRMKMVNVFAAEQFAPDFLTLNPNGKVPVIIDPEGGPDGRPLAVFESGAILFHLAEKTGTLLPAAGAGRTEVMQWLMLQMASVGPMLGQLNHFLFVAPEIEYARNRYRNEAMRLYRLLDTRLAGNPFVAGSAYSIADIALYPWVLYRERYDLDDTALPHLARWCEAVGARPAVRRAKARFDELTALASEAHRTATPEGLDRFFNRAPSAAGA